MALTSQAALTVHCAFGENSLHLELPVTSLDQQVQLLRCLSGAYTCFLEELKADDSALVERVERSIEVMVQLSERVRASSREKADHCSASCHAPQKSNNYMEAELRNASKATALNMERDIQKESEGGGPQRREPLPSQRRVGLVPGEVALERDDSESSDEEEEWTPPVRAVAVMPNTLDSSLQPFLDAVRECGLGQDDSDSSYSEEEEEEWTPPVREVAVMPNTLDSSLQRFLDAVREGGESPEDSTQNPSDFRSIMPSKQEKPSRSMSSRLRAAMREIPLPRLRASRSSGQAWAE